MIILLFTTEENAILTKIYQDYYPLMKYMAFKLVHDGFIADDMVQDAFVRLIDYLPTVVKLNENKLASYCVRTVESVSIDYIRRENSRRKYTDGRRIPEFRPEELIEQDEIKKEVHSVLAKMSQLDRHLLHYKYFMNYRYKEIGRLLGIDPKYIGTYIQRARDRAKRLLGGRGDYL